MCQMGGIANAIRQIAQFFLPGQLAELPGLAELLEEFSTFERQLTKAGTSQTFGNFREHSHDDHLFAIVNGPATRAARARGQGGEARPASNVTPSDHVTWGWIRGISEVPGRGPRVGSALHVMLG